MRKEKILGGLLELEYLELYIMNFPGKEELLKVAALDEGKKICLIEQLTALETIFSEHLVEFQKPRVFGCSAFSIPTHIGHLKVFIEKSGQKFSPPYDRPWDDLMLEECHELMLAVNDFYMMNLNEFDKEANHYKNQEYWDDQTRANNRMWFCIALAFLFAILTTVFICTLPFCGPLSLFGSIAMMTTFACIGVAFYYGFIKTRNLFLDIHINNLRAEISQLIPDFLQKTLPVPWSRVKESLVVHQNDSALQRTAKACAVLRFFTDTISQPEQTNLAKKPQVISVC